MTTQIFLSENRKEVISFYNSNIKNDSNLSLKEFMIDLMNNFKHVVKHLELYAMHNLMMNMFQAQERIGINNEIGVSYSKPYSQSNHAKMVNYHGKDKANKLTNL